MRSFGIVLVAIGLLWALVAFNMSTTVTSDPETYGSGEYSVHVPAVTVNNIGLMETRRNHLMFAGLTILIGVVLIGFGSTNQKDNSSNSALRPCPKCAELIQPAALKCRYCNTELSANFSEPALSYPANASEQELMHHFGIARENEMYVYRSYRYERLGDALAYAKQQAAKESGAKV